MRDVPIAVFAAFFSALAFGAEKQEFVIWWSCDQTVSLTPRPLAASDEVKVSYTHQGDQLVLDAAPWAEFLARARSGGTDYQSCIVNSMTLLPFGLMLDCEQKFGKEHPKCSKENIARAVLPVEQVSQRVIEELAGKQLLPPMLPLEERMRGNSNPGAPAATRLRNGCDPASYGRFAVNYAGATNEITSNSEAWTPKFITKDLPKIMAEVDSECRSAIVRGYLRMLSEIRLPEGCAPNGPAARGPVCARILEKTGAMLQELSRYSLEPGSKEDAFIKSLPACFANSPNFSEFLGKLEETFEVAKSCEALKQGVERPISSGHGSLRRLPDENGQEVYEAGLNLKFVPEGVEVDLEKFAADSRQCFLDAEPYLRTPSGARLRLVLETRENPAEIKIKKNDDGRSRAVAYMPDISCAARVHEALHLLGLRDEYFEAAPQGYQTSDTGQSAQAATGPRSLYPCRSLGPQRSIMHQHGMLGNAIRGRQPPEPWLFDSQLNVIAYPDCLLLTGTYRQCTKYQIDEKPPAVCGLPPACSDGTWITGAKAEEPQ